MRPPIYLLGLVVILLGSSCQRSQFATTTRSSKNGRVVYTNHFKFENPKTVRSKSLSNHLKQQEQPATAGVTSGPTRANMELTLLYPRNEEKLFASTSSVPVLMTLTKERKNTSEKLIFPVSSSVGSPASSSRPDTITKASSDNGKNAPVIGEQKVEKHGLIGFILSCCGLFPIIGIPFSIAGWVLGVKGLHRIKKDPVHYKGKGFAIASVSLGITGLVISLATIIGSFVLLILLSATN